MAKYLISNKAISDLDEIWDYTVSVWSEDQAIKYYNSIYSAISFLAEHSSFPGKSYYQVKRSLWGYRVGHHIIFYRKHSDNRVAIIRILHERMDISRHL